MKTVAVIEVASRGALGLPSNWQEDLAGRPLICRTVAAVVASAAFDEVVLACHRDELDSLKVLLADGGCDGTTLFAHSLAEPAARETRRAKRKFSLTGWRGGVDSSYLFGELAHPELLLAVADEYDAAAVAQFDAEAPFVDPAIVAGTLECLRSSGEFGAAFSATPPGLGAQLYSRQRLQQLSHEGRTLDEMIAYDPANLISEPMISPFCHTVDIAISSTRQRFAAHSPRLKELIFRLWEQLGEEGSRDAQRVVSQYKKMTAAGELENPFPREIEWELSPAFTVQDSLRPQSRRSGSADRELFAQRIVECAPWRDVCLTLGGHGEPLRHPDLLEMLRLARESVWGLHIVTHGAELTPQFVAELQALAPDVISVRLDAHTPDMWQRFKSGVDPVVIFEQLAAAAAALPATTIIPSFIKLRENMAEMEPFFDHWYATTGWAVIEGFNSYGDLFEDRNPLRLVPSTRQPCLSLMEQLIIYSDGAVPLCKQDVDAAAPLGSIAQSSLTELWQAGGDQRRAQQRGCFEKSERCANCVEWAHL